MLDKLKEFLLSGTKGLPDIFWWNSLDVDYYPPRVERLWIQKNGYRFYLHKIHRTDKPCLLHKHRWPSAIYMLYGAYEMGIAFQEEELIVNQEGIVLNEPASAAKILLNKGSAYEMTHTHGIHYVKPITDWSLSLMVTGPLYTEDRSESVNRELKALTQEAMEDLLKKCQGSWPTEGDIKRIFRNIS